MNYKHIFATNVLALMSKNPALDSHGKIAKQSRNKGKKISARTVGYALDIKDSKQPKLDSIVSIATAFGIPPWMLLTPDFDPLKKAGGVMPSERSLEIARRIEAKNLTDSEIDLFLKLISGGVPDHELEHLRAPVAAQPTKTKDYERAVKRRR